jgi:hypothetical protein
MMSEWAVYKKMYGWALKWKVGGAIVMHDLNEIYHPKLREL